MSRWLLMLASLLLLTGISLGAEKRSAHCWRPVPIPETWKDPPRESSDGFAWYRCWVRVPDSWRERTLELFVESADDARQSYVNGVRIGAAGTMPPRYRSGLGEFGRYAIPADLVHFGKHNMVTIRVYDDGGRSDFALAPPVLLAGAEGVRLEGDWQYRPGDDSEWARESSPNAEATFSNVERVDDVDVFVRRRRGDRDPLSPIQAVKAFQVAPDLKIEIALSEPHVRQPLFLSFDERGRLWVLEYLQYPDPTGLEAISRDKYLRTVYDKVPAPPPRHVRGRDRISIHEDSDGDGVYDRHTTFVDGLNIATSFARGRGGVFVLNPPYLLFYADGNNDDIPDGDPEVLLEGFGLEDTHSVVSNLRWGPDGWLYAAQGSTVTGNVKRPGGALARRSMGQLIWRYHPEWRRYEVFAEGGGNTFDVEIDAKGRVYSGTNGGNARGFHYVQGGYSWKGFGKHGALSNPYAFGYFEHMLHEGDRNRFAQAFCIYEGGLYPPELNGRIIAPNSLHNVVWASQLKRDTSTFRTVDEANMVESDDRWFRPVFAGLGPDGCVYLADWYDTRLSHVRPVDDWHKASGRIYRLRPKGNKPAYGIGNLSKLDENKLLKLLEHPNRWVRRRAVLEIGWQGKVSLQAALEKKVQANLSQASLEALWALSLLDRLTGKRALEWINHPDPHVRRWIIRLEGDRRKTGKQMAAAFRVLSEKEKDVEVRSQLAASAKRFLPKHGLPILMALSKHRKDMEDKHLPLMIWWGIEAHAESGRDLIRHWFSESETWEQPMIREFIAQRLIRRYAMGGGKDNFASCADLLESAPSDEIEKILFTGLQLAFQGMAIPELPERLARRMEAFASKTGKDQLVLGVLKK
ncbi:MAG: dehydrogenase, partial [Planctomycetes bacterium]|nr:dehydrogenase [Planctomycetota bacterium]